MPRIGGLFVISATPIREGYSVVGSAWSVKRISDLPGLKRRDGETLAQLLTREPTRCLPTDTGGFLDAP
jgi:hypothetical protein